MPPNKNNYFSLNTDISSKPKDLERLRQNGPHTREVCPDLPRTERTRLTVPTNPSAMSSDVPRTEGTRMTVHTNPSAVSSDLPRTEGTRLTVHTNPSAVSSDLPRTEGTRVNAW